MAESIEPKFIFNGTGTQGDLLPFLAIARELQGKGHDCHVLGNASVQRHAAELGVPFTAVAPAQSNILTSVEENFENYVFAAYQPTFDFIERELNANARVVVVNAQAYDASSHLCELYRLPLCRLVLAPYRLRSLAAPPGPLSDGLSGRLERAYRKYTLPALYASFDSHPFILRHMNEHRRKLGLAALDSLRALDAQVQRYICWFPDWFCPPAPDWPQNLDQVGFPLPSASASLPERLSAFIDRHGAPIVFTPGTGVVDVERFFAAARGACEALGCAGVFLSPNICSASLETSANLIHFDYVDLQPLLSRAALLVHHGGMGTTARALEAGVPQIVSPQAFDQPDNAQRVAKLGVGTVIEREQLTASALAEAAMRLWQSTETRKALAMYADRTRTTAAVARAASLVTRHFSSLSEGAQTQPGSGLGRASTRTRPAGRAASARSEFVFAGLGTKGDLFPLLALGKEMVRRGHGVHLLANEGYAILAESHGLSFTPVTVKQEDNLVSSEDNLNHHVLPSYGPSEDFFRERVGAGRAPIVVNLDEFSATNALCERYELPVCRIHLAANRIRSLVRPPWPFHKWLEGPLPAARRKYHLPLVYSHMARSLMFIPALNKFRQRLGLAPVRTTDEIDRVVQLHFGFFPSWFAEPAEDWPSPFELCGFPLPASSTTPPRALTELIERHGKPLVFTPGTGVKDVDQFFADARQCCDALGMPGVFLSPHFRMPSGGLGSRILHFEFIDLELVLKGAALLVHHGGIGTTARAFQAGIPQIVRPRLYDQPDNADRVARLGVGSHLPPEDDSNDSLVEAVRQLTSSAAVGRQLRRFKQSIAGSDAIELAADALERRLVTAQHSTRKRLAG